MCSEYCCGQWQSPILWFGLIELTRSQTFQMYEVKDPFQSCRICQSFQTCFFPLKLVAVISEETLIIESFKIQTELVGTHCRRRQIWLFPCRLNIQKPASWSQANFYKLLQKILSYNVRFFAAQTLIFQIWNLVYLTVEFQLQLDWSAVRAQPTKIP